MGCGVLKGGDNLTQATTGEACLIRTHWVTATQLRGAAGALNIGWLNQEGAVEGCNSLFFIRDDLLNSAEGDFTGYTREVKGSAVVLKLHPLEPVPVQAIAAMPQSYSQKEGAKNDRPDQSSNPTHSTMKTAL